MSPRADNLRLLINASYQSLDWLLHEEGSYQGYADSVDPLQDFLPGIGNEIASAEQRRLVEEALDRRVENGGRAVNVALLRSLLRRAAAQRNL